MKEPSPVDIPPSIVEWRIPLVLFAGIALVWSWLFLRSKYLSAPKLFMDPPMVRAEREDNPKDKGQSFLITALLHFNKGEMDEAGFWYARAALTENPKGMGIYGAGVMEGLWRPKHPVLRNHEGAEWLTKGANEMDPNSIYFAGVLNYSGTCGPKDEARGLEYIREAAKLKCKAAIKFLEDLEKGEIPEKIWEA
jgi:hypothetical protein